MRKLLWLIIILSAVGVTLSVYQLLHNTGITEGAICNLGEKFSCDLVNRSEYAKVFGFPVAGIGIIGYLLMMVGGILKLRNREDKGLSLFLLVSSSLGLAFSIYLTSIEAFVLDAWCIVCIFSQIIVATIFVAALTVWNYDKKSRLK